MSVTARQREHYATQLIVEHVVTHVEQGIVIDTDTLRVLAQVVLEARAEVELSTFLDAEVRRIANIIEQPTDVRIEYPDEDH